MSKSRMASPIPMSPSVSSDRKVFSSANHFAPSFRAFVAAGESAFAGFFAFDDGVENGDGVLALVGRDGQVARVAARHGGELRFCSRSQKKFACGAGFSHSRRTHEINDRLRARR